MRDQARRAQQALGENNRGACAIDLDKLGRFSVATEYFMSRQS